MDNKPSGKVESYLTFKIDNEIYAASVNNVISILELRKITKIPRSPEYIKGVINLRGTVLPIVDMKIKFGLAATEFTTNTSILVLEVNVDNELVKVGGLVDSVLEVLEISDTEILPPPSLGKNYSTDFVHGMYKSDDTFFMILNIEHLFTEDELTTIGSNIFYQEEKLESE